MKTKLSFLIAILVLSKTITAQVVTTESFDGATFVPPTWTDLLVSGTNTWSRVTAGTSPTQSTHSGSGEAMFNSFSVSGGVRALISPVIDYSLRGAATPTISFWMYRDNGYNTTADKIDVYVNTSKSLTGATLLGTANRAIGLAPTVSAGGWYKYTYNIPAAYTSNSNYILFKATSAYGNNIYMDDVSWSSYPVAVDAAGIQFTSPSSGLSCFGSSQSISVQVKNSGSAVLDFSINPLTISVSVNGPLTAGSNTLAPYTLGSGTLAIGATQTVTLPSTINLSSSGNYTFTGTASVSNDGNPNNNALITTTILVSKVNTFPHQVDFSSLPSPEFMIQQVSGSGQWSVVTTGNLSNPALAPVMNSTNGFAYFNSYSFSSGTVANLITPLYDMSTLTLPAMDLWVSQDNGWSGYNDKLDILVSTDGGLTWSNSLLTIPRYNAAYSTPGWKQFTIPLTAYAGNSCVRIAIQATSAFGNNIAIDYLKVYNMGGALPVKLISFTGEAQSGTSNKLSWVTASEENTAQFLLQRSSDGIHFNTVHTHPASNSITGHSYQYIDQTDGSSDIYYYRLVSVDMDQSMQNHNIISIERQAGKNQDANIYPNPSSDYFNIAFHSEQATEADIQLTDMRGNSIIMTHTTLEKGRNILNLDAKPFENGLYFVRLIDSHSGNTLTLLKWMKNG